MTSSRIELPGPNAASRQVVVRKRFIRSAVVFDEEWLQGEPVEDPAGAIAAVKAAPGVVVIFNFARAMPETSVLHPYHVEWENVAVASTANFKAWWEGLPQESRKNVRRSERRGVTVREVSFSDELMEGLRVIYNETPIRQGRKFPHYGKSFQQVKEANSSYLDRSTLIGAFHQEQLIGFVKFVIVNRVARIMQIIAMDAHTDKRPTNALLAKAMEIACTKPVSHLVYGRYIYGKKANSPVTEFKRRNGFDQLLYPRYFVPLTWKGRAAIPMQLHRELSDILPEGVTNLFLKVRASLYRKSAIVSKPVVDQDVVPSASNSV
jgi:hypothetical protein